VTTRGLAKNAGLLVVAGSSMSLARTWAAASALPVRLVRLERSGESNHGANPERKEVRLILKLCRHCGYVSPNPDARFCGKCGSIFVEPKKAGISGKRLLAISAALLGIGILIGIGINSTNSPGPAPVSNPAPVASVESTPEAPPEHDCAPVAYIKEVNMEHEGEDGLVVWFRAVDADDHDTCASGTLTLNIFAYGDEPSFAFKVYSGTATIAPSDFTEYAMMNRLTGMALPNCSGPIT
jgi:hypothetical protein